MLARIAAGEHVPSTPLHPMPSEGLLGNVGRGWTRRVGGGYTSSGRMGHGGK